MTTKKIKVLEIYVQKSGRKIGEVYIVKIAYSPQQVYLEEDELLKQHQIVVIRLVVMMMAIMLKNCLGWILPERD